MWTAEQLFGHISKSIQRYIPGFVPAIFPRLASADITAGIAPATAAAEAELSSDAAVTVVAVLEGVISRKEVVPRKPLIENQQADLPTVDTCLLKMC